MPLAADDVEEEDNTSLSFTHIPKAGLDLSKYFARSGLEPSAKRPRLAVPEAQPPPPPRAIASAPIVIDAGFRVGDEVPVAEYERLQISRGFNYTDVAFRNALSAVVTRTFRPGQTCLQMGRSHIAHVRVMVPQPLLITANTCLICGCATKGFMIESTHIRGTSTQDVRAMIDSPLTVQYTSVRDQVIFPHNYPDEANQHWYKVAVYNFKRENMPTEARRFRTLWTVGANQCGPISLAFFNTGGRYNPAQLNTPLLRNEGTECKVSQLRNGVRAMLETRRDYIRFAGQPPAYNGQFSFEMMMIAALYLRLRVSLARPRPAWDHGQGNLDLQPLHWVVLADNQQGGHNLREGDAGDLLRAYDTLMQDGTRREAFILYSSQVSPTQDPGSSGHYTVLVPE